MREILVSLLPLQRSALCLGDCVGCKQKLTYDHVHVVLDLWCIVCANVLA